MTNQHIHVDNPVDKSGLGRGYLHKIIHLCKQITLNKHK